MNLLLFAGTTEGRELAQELLRRFPAEIYVCVATEYGGQLLPEHPRLHRQTGRMDGSAIRDFIRKIQPACVPGRHPIPMPGRSPGISSRPARKPPCRCCASSALPLSGTGGGGPFGGRSRAAAPSDPGPYPAHHRQQGSRGVYPQIEDYPERVFARILPSAENIRQAQALGFRGSHLICMQGTVQRGIQCSPARQIQAGLDGYQGFRPSRRQQKKNSKPLPSQASVRSSSAARKNPRSQHSPWRSPSVPGAAVSSPAPTFLCSKTCAAGR